MYLFIYLVYYYTIEMMKIFNWVLGYYYIKCPTCGQKFYISKEFYVEGKTFCSIGCANDDKKS